jgi:hypothetical protein
MYTVTLNELKAVLNVSAQAGQSGSVKENLSGINGPGWRIPGSKEMEEATL